MNQQPGRDLLEQVFITIRDVPEDFDVPAPIAGFDIGILKGMSQSEKDALLRRLLEFASAHARPRPIDEPIRYGTLLL